MSLLNLGLRVLAADDDVVTSNPQLRTADRNRSLAGIQTGAARTVPVRLAAGDTLTAFDATRVVGADGTTQLALTTSALAPDRYRLTWTGTGTNPAFRTDRLLAANGHGLVLTLNANLTVTVTGTGPAYTNVLVGDQVLIPGAATGDAAGPFSPLNVGYWDVLAVSGTSLTLARPPADPGTATTETVAVTAATQIVAMSPGPVLAGDQLTISGGFSTNARRTHAVLAVAPTYVDVRSTVALAPETAIPGSNGLTVYAEAQVAVLVETDQLLGVYLNGAATETATLDVLTAQDGTRLGVLLLTGPIHKLQLTNKSTTRATGLVVGFPAA